MPPKKAFTRENIIAAGVEVIRKYGRKGLSARTIAKELDASTMPIYSVVASIEELKPEITEKITQLFMSYATASHTGNFQIDTAFGYIRFARQERQLFRSMMFADDPEEIVTYQTHKQRVAAILFERIKQMPEMAGFEDAQIKRIMEKMYVVTHGLACLTNSGRLEDDREETILALLQSFSAEMIQHERLLNLSTSHK